MTTFPLTHAQKGIITELLQRPDCTHYNLPSKLDLPLDVDFEQIIASLDRVINAHPSWKTTFIQENGDIRQVYDPSKVFKTRYFEMSDEQLERYTANFIRPFDLFSDELCRFSVIRTPSKIRVLIDALHTVTDGLTFINFIKEVGIVYNGGEPVKETKNVFEHALSQQEFDESPMHEKITLYYKERYCGKEFPTIAPARKNVYGRTIEKKAILPREKAEECCEKYGMRMSSLLNAAYCVLLSCYSGSNSISYTTLLHGRDRKTMNTHGTFISTLPFCMEIDPQMSVKELVDCVGREFMGIMRRQEYAFTDFVKNTAFIPETIFSYQGPKIRNTVTLGSCIANAEQMRVSENTDSPLGIVVYEIEDGIEICAECSEARFSEEYIRQFALSYAAVLDNMTENPEAAVSAIGVLPGEQQRALVQAGTAPSPKASPYNSVLEAFKAAREAAPDKTAVKSSEEEYTYAQLDTASEKIAAYFRSTAPGRTSANIPLETSRQAHTIAAMLGIMKAGLCYIPLDPSYPEEWKEYIVKDCGAGEILSDATVKAIIDSEEMPEYSSGTTDPKTAAYIIYTSGSTGKPKGAIISHRALWAFVQGISEVLEISKEDRISCHSSFSFDASVEDIYPILTVGGTLFIVPELLRKDIAALASWLEQNRISGGNYTTRLGQMLMDTCELPSLRYIVLGGEKMTIWPKKARNIATFNTYGPTEFTVDATYFRLRDGKDFKNIPIGKALPGMTAMVADHNGNPLPPGVSGEIILSGAQLSDGYLGNEALTQAAFPFSELFPQKRYYKTGDIGFVNKDGDLEFLRRKDNQVKVSGFRIELEEIDSRIGNIPGVKQAKTVVRAGGKLLCCYYVADENVGAEQIKSALEKELPSYMIPGIITRMDSLPLGPGGKLDTSRLPEPSAESSRAIDPGENEDERKMLEIVHDILGRKDVGVTDDLISFGISSIQLMEMVVKAFQRGIKININEAYGCRTIRELLAVEDAKTEPYRYNADSGKPEAVFICGITGLKRALPLVRNLSRGYSVYVIPPIDSCAANSDGKLSRLSSVEFVDRYLQGYLKEAGDRMPALICGHSFGGELAYVMASLIYNRYGELPSLELYDTTHHLPMQKVLKAKMGKRLPENLKLYLRMHDTSMLRDYPGEITLYSSQKREEDMLPGATSAEKAVLKPLIRHLSAAANEKRWTARHPSICIKELDCGHEEILDSICTH